MDPYRPPLPPAVRAAAECERGIIAERIRGLRLLADGHREDGDVSSIDAAVRREQAELVGFDRLLALGRKPVAAI